VKKPVTKKPLAKKAKAKSVVAKAKKAIKKPARSASRKAAVAKANKAVKSAKTSANKFVKHHIDNAKRTVAKARRAVVTRVFEPMADAAAAVTEALATAADVLSEVAHAVVADEELDPGQDGPSPESESEQCGSPPPTDPEKRAEGGE
jgi:hypothetical protein